MITVASRLDIRLAARLVLGSSRAREEATTCSGVQWGEKRESRHRVKW